MIKVRINTSKSYDVIIGEGLLDTSGKLVREVASGAAVLAIVSDSNVWPLYGERVKASLAAEGFKVIEHVIPAGEEHKSMQTYQEVLSFLADNRVGRNDILVALGGGVVGDLTGFAAATYRRGIRYIQMPTTLLASVDSSVGGKTAVDLPQGKNLVGAFHQPELVVCDTETLETLSFDIFRDGCSEVIKYALLGNADFFDALMETMVEDQIEDVIAECVSMKRDIVNKDEFDRGLRATLNMGHTFGHAIEKLSNYELSHGRAVAIGMRIISDAACRMGYSDDLTPYMVERILNQYSLPTSCDFSAEDIIEAALSDKKAEADSISLIVPTGIGSCKVVKVKLEELKNWCV